MVCAPIPVALTAAGLMTIAQRRSPGIWQFSTDRDVSYAAIARQIAERANADPALVQAVPAAAGSSFEHNPAHTTLDAGRASRELGLDFPPPLEAIDAACLT
jgi:dTDP-4-dehydrorhamnose reductase